MTEKLKALKTLRRFCELDKMPDLQDAVLSAMVEYAKEQTSAKYKDKVEYRRVQLVSYQPDCISYSNSYVDSLGVTYIKRVAQATYLYKNNDGKTVLRTFEAKRFSPSVEFDNIAPLLITVQANEK